MSFDVRQAAGSREKATEYSAKQRRKLPTFAAGFAGVLDLIELSCAFSTAAGPGQPARELLTREEKVRWLEQSWRFGPALWWPDDRAWVVVSEIDFGWTYVGGSDETLKRVLAHPELEAWPAQLTDRFTDPLNAALDAPDA